MKTPYFGTNTKMFKTPSEACEHIRRLAELTRDIRDRMHLFVIPSYTSLPSAVSAAEGTGICIGAQSMGWEERGQLTGEIAPPMLKEIGVSLVMIGHSERRHVLHETDLDEEKRVSCAVRNGMKTLLCVGETTEQKAYGISEETVRTQLKVALHSVTPEEARTCLWIAYEPVWAIGTTGVPATEQYAKRIHEVIRDTLNTLFGADIGLEIPILYGGSVNNENALRFIRQPEIDGLFIGRSAWDAENFNAIIREALPLFEQCSK